MTDPQLLSRLHKAGPKLPPKLHAAILAEGPRAVLGLVAMLSKEELFGLGPKSDGFGPVHAVNLLCELGAPEAIPPLLETFFAKEWDLALHDPIIRGLQRFGALALEPVLAALDAARDEHDRAALCEVLAKIGVRDERLFQAFCDLFEADPVYGALTLAEYGDRRATALIGEVLEVAASKATQLASSPHASREDDEFGPRDLLQIAAAYRSLGGQFSTTMEGRIGRALAEAEEIRQQHLRAGTKASSAKVGRNDPCPCGSGKKFKKCCGAAAS